MRKALALEQLLRQLHQRRSVNALVRHHVTEVDISDQAAGCDIGKVEHAVIQQIPFYRVPQWLPVYLGRAGSSPNGTVADVVRQPLDLANMQRQPGVFGQHRGRVAKQLKELRDDGGGELGLLPVVNQRRHLAQRIVQRNLAVGDVRRIVNKLGNDAFFQQDDRNLSSKGLV